LVGNTVYHGTPPLGAGVWNSTALSLRDDMPGRWLDIISGERLEASDTAPTKNLFLRGVFNNFPVALLYHEDALAESQLIGESLHAAIV
jgi:maltooligosyltrehalose synthase